MNSSRKTFLGITIDDITQADALAKAKSFLLSAGQFKIFTPNPEMIVKSQTDKLFKRILNSGDLNLCDGFGLSFFAKANRITGVDFTQELCGLAIATGKSIFLLGSKQNTIQAAVDNLKLKFPNLKIVGFDAGPEFVESVIGDDGLKIDPTDNQNIINQINQSQADIVLVAFGMGKQEKWINANLSKIPQVKIALGVGGTFDFIAGTITRAPQWMRKIGLEWLYRLFKQPGRFIRIFNAVIIFTLLSIADKLKTRDKK